MKNQRCIPDKLQLQNQANNNQNTGIYTYTYTPMSKVKTAVFTSKIKYSRLIWQTKEIKNYT